MGLNAGLAAEAAGVFFVAEPGSFMEARAGIEPACTDLQSAASPLRHRASIADLRGFGAVRREKFAAQSFYSSRRLLFFQTISMRNHLLKRTP